MAAMTSYTRVKKTRKPKKIEDVELSALIQAYEESKRTKAEETEQAKAQATEENLLTFLDLFESAWAARDGACVLGSGYRETTFTWPVPGQVEGSVGFVTLLEDGGRGQGSYSSTKKPFNCTITNTDKKTPGRMLIVLKIRDSRWHGSSSNESNTLAAETKTYEELKHTLETLPALLARGEKAALPGIAPDHPMLLEAHELLLDDTTKKVKDLLATVDAFIECTEAEKEGYQTKHDNLPSPLRKLAMLAEEPEFKAKSKKRTK